eukprot:s411_g21.t1
MIVALIESSLLLFAIAASWVSVAQLARAAEVDTLQLQHHSVVPLVTWANATAWLLLALPYMARRAKQRKDLGDGAMSCDLLKTEAFQVSQPPRFLFIALTTNFSYIAALHYLPASLNTAIFSSNPVFTLLLQSLFLPEGRPSEARGTDQSQVCSSLWSGKALSVTLSVVGVLLITEPILGAALSLFAALGTSIYQVYFKRTFGDQMKPEEASLGGVSSHSANVALELTCTFGWMFSVRTCRTFRRLRSPAFWLRGLGQGASNSVAPPPPQKVPRCDETSRGDSVALFIDGENLSPAALRPMLQVLEQNSGEILQSRVYIGKHQASFARAAELEGIERISVPQNGASMKESGDLMLALDAAEACLSGTCKTIAIASEETPASKRSKDLDFLILLRKLRTWGCRSILLLPQRPMSRKNEEGQTASELRAPHCHQPLR